LETKGWVYNSLLTSPKPSSAVLVWISFPRFHNHYVGRVLPTADGQYPALPVKHHS